MRQFWRIFRPSFFSFKEFWPRYRGYDLGSFKEANAFCSNLHRSGPLNSGVEVVLQKVVGLCSFAGDGGVFQVEIRIDI